MSDNYNVKDAAGNTIAIKAKEVSTGIFSNRIIPQVADADVSNANPIPISDAGGSLTVDGTVAVSGSVAVTGTFYQATQPVSVASQPLPTGASTEATLAAASAKLPATLGQKTSVNSMAVVVASDQSALPVAGNYTAATGNFTRPANTTAYAAGQIISNSVTAGSCAPITLTVARASNTTGAIRRASLKVNDSAWLNATVRVHLFQDSPTFSAGDGGTLTANLTESGYLGYLDVTIDRSFASTTVKGHGVPAVGAEINFTPSSGTQNIFAVLEARSAVTPAASKVFTVVVEALQN